MDATPRTDAGSLPRRHPGKEQTMRTNDKTLHELDPPLPIEVLVYEVRVEAYETWKAAEYDFWTKGLADRFAFFVDKQTWLHPGHEWHKVTIVISWASEDAWKSI